MPYGVRDRESMTHVWVSPLGEKKYANSEAMTTITRPTMMLALFREIRLISLNK